MKYYDLQEILSLDLDDRVKQEFQNKFKKRVYFEFNSGTRIGELIGLEDNNYIILSNGKEILLNNNNSISLL